MAAYPAGAKRSVHSLVSAIYGRCPVKPSESNMRSRNPARRYQDLILDTGQGRFAVRDFSGTGPDLLLVHGTGHNLEVWTPLAEQLAGDFHLVAFDLRGHGRTDVDSTDAEQYWRDIEAIVCLMGLHRPVLVGHSTGAFAVTAYAADGGACSAAVLLDGFVLQARRTPEEAASWRLDREALWERFRYGWLASGPEMETYVARMRGELSAQGADAALDPALAEALTRRTFRQVGGHYLRRPTLEDLEAVCRCDTAACIYPERAIYDRLAVPTGFVLASQGSFAHLRDEIQALVAQRDGRWFAEIKAGHNLHMQTPVEVAGLLRAHCAQ